MKDVNLDYMRRIDGLLALTLSLPPEKRVSYLEHFSEEDLEIRRTVLDMLSKDLENPQQLESKDALESPTLLSTHSSGKSTLTGDLHGLIGKQIQNYEIIDLIGGGGMGVVYKGRDVKLDRFVALKFLSPRLVENAQTKERFLNEARAASRLDHPNIGIVHEITETEDGKPFISMAFYDGETLKEIMASRKLSPEQAISYTIQIAEAIAFSHRNGIVHRDIKPSNIIVTRENTVKIVDFGLALFMDRPSPNDGGKIMGTMGYMSPEQYQGVKTDSRTDIWSIGVILHEMLFGKKPAPSVFSIIDTAPRFASAISKHTALLKLNTSMLNHVLTHTLQDNPEDRYKSATELVTHLRKTLPHYQSLSELIQGSLSQIARRPLLVSGIVVCALVITFLLSLALSTSNKNLGSSIGIQLLVTDSMSVEDNSYLSTGVTQELIHHLAKFDALKVVSLMHLDSLNKSAGDFTQPLNLTWITHGTIHRLDDNIRISLELRNTSTNHVVSMINVEDNQEDLQNLIYDVALSIIHDLKIGLDAEEEDLLSESLSVDPDAYEAYLRGRYHFQMETPEHLEKAIDWYDEAILKAPSFARAYASKVVPTYLLGDKYARIPTEASFYLAREYADKALSLDDQLPEAYIAQGIVRQLIDQDYEGAMRSFERAIELNAQESEAYREYGLLLLRMGNIERGLAQLYHSQSLDPTSIQTHRDIARGHYYNYEFEKAIDILNEILALRPGYVRAYNLLAYSLLELDRYGDAEEAYLEALKFDSADNEVNNLGFLAELKAASNEPEEAKKIIQEMLTHRSNQKSGGAAALTLAYASLNDIDQTEVWLEKAIEEQDLPPSWLVDPRWKKIRENPNWAPLLSLPERL